ncbi:MAG: restriction endonuclease [Candidatus Entotheonellia bacterium]
MNKPTPEDFGLNDKQIAYFRSLKENRKRFYKINRYSMAIIAGITFLLSLPFAGFLGAIFAAVFIGAMVGSVLGLIINGIDRLSTRKHTEPMLIYQAAQKDYDQAKKEHEAQVRARELAQKEYEARQVRVKGQFWQSLTGPQFEHEMAQLFSRVGYQVHVTPSSGDEGIDLVLRRDDKKIVAQCKAHRNPVGPSVVRDLYGAMMHANANEAILVALGGFTQGVVGFVKGKPIRLMSLPDILALADSPILGKDAASYPVLSPDKARVLQTLKKEVESGNLRPVDNSTACRTPLD